MANDHDHLFRVFLGGILYSFFFPPSAMKRGEKGGGKGEKRERILGVHTGHASVLICAGGSFGRGFRMGKKHRLTGRKIKKKKRKKKKNSRGKHSRREVGIIEGASMSFLTS